MNKTCSRCGEKKEESGFRRKGRRHCTDCLNQEHREWVSKNRERRSCSKKKSYQKMMSDELKRQAWLARSAVQSRYYRQRHPDRLESGKDRYARERETLPDHFIKHALAGEGKTRLSYRDIPQDLVDMKRMHMLIKKELQKQ